MSKIIDFGRFGKYDVEKESFNFNLYKLINPLATIEMFEELKGLNGIQSDENLEFDIKKMEHDLIESSKKHAKKHKK